MVQQRSNLFGRVRAGSSGGLHHNARVFQSLLFGVLSQLATNDVRSPEVARKKNRDKNKIKEDQEVEYPHKRATEGAKIILVTRSMHLQRTPFSAPSGKTDVPSDVIVKARQMPRRRSVDRNKAATAHNSRVRSLFNSPDRRQETGDRRQETGDRSSGVQEFRSSGVQEYRRQEY